jgi:hypothetical protein
MMSFKILHATLRAFTLINMDNSKYEHVQLISLTMFEVERLFFIFVEGERWSRQDVRRIPEDLGNGLTLLQAFCPFHSLSAGRQHSSRTAATDITIATWTRMWSRERSKCVHIGQVHATISSRQIVNIT